MIFISYRRKDEPFAAGRIFTDLSHTFGKEFLFKDVDNIRFGDNFKEVIFNHISKAQIFLTVIGENWNEQNEEGLFRLFEKEDYIRLEIECALHNGTRIIPVLIGDAKMPKTDSVPESIHTILPLNAAKVRVDPDWTPDMQRLTSIIKDLISNDNALIDAAQVNKDVKAEENLWSYAKKTNIIKRYKSYLEQFPNGKYAAEAKSKIETIRKKFIADDIESQETEITTETHEKLDNVFITVKGGEFIMGSFGTENEEPPHKVSLQGYAISGTPVTVGQYRTYCLQTGKLMPGAPKWGWNDIHPMVNVTWHEAFAYCEWAGGRLPTEAEWEYAAKGAHKSEESAPLGQLEFSGRSIGKQSETMPVATYEANKIGLYDMGGNINEWCYDFYADYDSGRKINPRGPMRGITKVVKGWPFDDTRNRSHSQRKESFADERSSSLGFRIVKEILNR
ncbi:SUMF1/EgtB/PvdO family nonheme iron enzyme [Flavobacterium sp.]|uniref:SUMF1/EgtB/PvdO family nonheme iron enzyme n=1 Tax=Flavobacterium sp. TaxID=239 RepID=UPI002628591D|nr:SUMF1/EgtB/PvdO family nonheme iron enzyme [Flavobacterium sp.]